MKVYHIGYEKDRDPESIICADDDGAITAFKNRHRHAEREIEPIFPTTVHYVEGGKLVYLNL